MCCFAARQEAASKARITILDIVIPLDLPETADLCLTGPSDMGDV